MAKQLRYGSVEIYIDDILGVGSYGKVCKGKCGQLPCAVKLLHDTMFQHGDPGIHSFVRRFEQECQFLSSIKHPNIVQYLGTIANPESGRPVLLMELMDESLTKHLERSTGPLPYYTQVNICHDISLALAYLHFNAIIHRDLSGNNVLLIGAGSRAKVTDFGMSKLVDMNPRMTPLTQCPGTSVYMPPEALIISPGYSSKLDCFSLGVLGIQIVTRKFPNPGDAYTYIKDPKYPTGRALIPVPEIDRRKEDIDLISADHSLLPVMLQCIKDLDEDRPSADELCEQLSSLKREAKYMHSKDQSNDQSSLVQRLQLGVETKEQEIQLTIETKTKEFETTLQQKTEEHKKAIQRNTEERKRALQQKTEEHKRELQQKAEEHKRELQQKTEELQQKAEEHKRELEEKEQIIQGLRDLKSGTDVQHKEDEMDQSNNDYIGRDLKDPRLDMIVSAETTTEYSSQLHEAASAGKLDLVKQLIAKGHNPMVKDRDNNTALHYAARYGKLDVIKFLIEEVSCNPAPSGWYGETPLHSAAEKGHLSIVEYLIEKHQVDPLCQDEEGCSPLHRACVGGDLNVVKFMMKTMLEYMKIEEIFTDSSKHETTPIHEAALKGHLNIVKYMISECKCDPNRGGYYGRGVIFSAAQKGHLSIVKFLTLECGCHPESTDMQQWTPLHVAAKCGHLPVIQFLSQKMKSNPNYRDERNNTPLHEAAGAGHCEVVEYFIDTLHCSPNTPGQYGRMPLHMASQEGHLNLVKNLVEKYACDPNSLDDNKVTPLHMAARFGHLYIVRYLTQNKECNNMCQVINGNSPLHWAAKYGQLSVVKHFVESLHCPPHIKNKFNKTPLQLALEKGHSEVVDYLQ